MIDLIDVSKSYGPGLPAVNHANLHVDKGEFVFIVGNSGSGKSTIIKLLLNNYEVSKGTLYINDIDINTINIENIYQHISIVHQNAPILNDTLKNNITYFKEYSDNQITEVIEKAGLKDFVNALPENLNTVINENGNNISGGEKQRISIARALLKDADLLIYDEPTSNLDHTTAKEIESILLNIDKTCFMITHKLDKELLSKFDEILVLKDGSLKEAGSYQQLVDEGAFFKQLLKGTS